MRNAAAIALAVAFLASMAGCVGGERTWRREAFSEGRTMAIVSVSYDPRILPVRGRDAVPYRQKDANVVRGSARDIFADTLPRVLDALGGTRVFALVPEDQVIRAFPRELFVTAPPDMEMAKGYPPPRPPRELAPLARQLGVDAVINLGVFFGYDATLLDYGLDSVGAVHADVVFSVAAVDRSGRVVWRDVVSGRSRTPVSGRRSTLDGERLFGSLQEAAVEATSRLVSRLREHVQR